jgi:hypothetical protein
MHPHKARTTFVRKDCARKVLILALNDFAEPVLAELLLTRRKYVSVERRRTDCFRIADHPTHDLIEDRDADSERFTVYAVSFPKSSPLVRVGATVRRVLHAQWRVLHSTPLK